MEKEKELELGEEVDLGRVSNTLIVYAYNKYQTKKKQRQAKADSSIICVRLSQITFVTAQT